MNVIIPMTGYGSRFVAAGYKELKPFIKVMGRPVIEWIVKEMYPSEVTIIFVCRGEHLKSDPSMAERLLALAPEAKIVSIEDWVKKGPVYDVLRGYRELLAKHDIDAEEPCIINYCAPIRLQTSSARSISKPTMLSCSSVKPIGLKVASRTSTNFPESRTF